MNYKRLELTDEEIAERLAFKDNLIKNKNGMTLEDFVEFANKKLKEEESLNQPIKSIKSQYYEPMTFKK